MNIIILNGSPREKQSFTYQYYRYLQINFPDHNYKVYHISRKIKKIEQDEQYFFEILEDIEKADGVIWLYPVYIQLIPALLHARHRMTVHPIL